MCIRLDVHEIPETIQMLENEVPGCRPSKHSNTPHSVRLSTDIRSRNPCLKFTLTLPETELGIICAKIGTKRYLPSKLTPVNGHDVPSRLNIYITMSLAHQRISINPTTCQSLKSRLLSEPELRFGSYLQQFIRFHRNGLAHREGCAGPRFAPPWIHN